MSATGPFATILSERAALLLAVVSGAVESVAEEEPDDESGLEDEIKVAAGREPVETVEMPEVNDIVGSVVLGELLKSVEDVAVTKADVLEVVVVGIWIGPGPRDSLLSVVLCARTLPAIMAKMKKA